MVERLNGIEEVWGSNPHGSIPPDSPKTKKRAYRAPSVSSSFRLPSVAAAVIGGTSIFGGRGSYAGTIVGALILTVLGTMLTLLQIPEGGRRILFGAMILAVTALYLRLTDQG